MYTMLRDNNAIAAKMSLVSVNKIMTVVSIECPTLFIVFKE